MEDINLGAYAILYKTGLLKLNYGYSFIVLFVIIFAYIITPPSNN